MYIYIYIYTYIVIVIVIVIVVIVILVVIIVKFKVGDFRSDLCARLGRPDPKWLRYNNNNNNNNNNNEHNNNTNDNEHYINNNDNNNNNRTDDNDKQTSNHTNMIRNIAIGPLRRPPGVAAGRRQDLLHGGPPDAAGERAERGRRGKLVHTRSRKQVTFLWRMPLTIHRTIPVKIHWTSDSPLEDTDEQ